MESQPRHLRVAPVETALDGTPRHFVLPQLPLNLLEWFPQETVFRWVAEELQALPADVAKENGKKLPIRDQRWHELAQVLTSAYSMGIFLSADIERACWLDEVFKKMCGREKPLIQDLEHFRRTNREALEKAFAGVLIRAVSERFHKDVASPLELQALAEERLDIARHLNTDADGPS